jgi:hypothetical protein
MLSGIDTRDRSAGNLCMQVALTTDALKGQAVNIYTSVSIDIERLDEIVRRLREGSFAASDCAFLSYGRGLDDLGAQDILPLLEELGSHHGPEGIWTALEIISMYQYGRELLDSQIEDFIKRRVTSPILLGSARRTGRDGYLFESLVELVQKRGGLDDEFATALGEQIARVCQAKDYEVLRALDDAIRKTIKLLVTVKPLLIWQSISRFFELATSLERHSLESLVGPAGDGSDGENHNREGVLFGVPEEYLTEWTKTDPVRRIEFLCVFYPLLAPDEAGVQTWHQAMERLATEFGRIPEFHQAIARRFRPSSWWGSIVPHLQVYLRPLEKWFTHSVPELSRWAREAHRDLEKQIALEKKREEEDLYH